MTQSVRSALLAVSAVLTVFFLFDLPAKAQITPPQILITCGMVKLDTPPTLRSEGLTELVGDLLMQCTGGTPTPAGQPVPAVNFTLNLNTNITSRTSADGTSEALLLIDEPGGKSNPTTPQLVCTPTDGSGTCPVLGTGTGIGTFNGTAGRQNIFAARQTGPNQLTFWGVPVDQPGTNNSNNTRVFRITNVRANASQLGASSNVMASLSTSGPFAFPITNSLLQVGTIQQGLNFSMQGQQTVPNCLPLNNIFLTPNPIPPSPTFSVNFGEGFSNSYKPARGPSSTLQNVPGQVYNSESGFILPQSGGQTAGLADFGTRLKAVFNNIPAGVIVFVQTANTSTPTPTAPGSTISAQLVLSESTLDPKILGTSTSNGLTQLPVINGSASAVWEVVNSDPAAKESLSFPVFFSFQPGINLNQNQPPATITVSGGFGSGSVSSPQPRDENNFLAQSPNQKFPLFMRSRNSFAGLTIAQCQGLAPKFSLLLPSGCGPAPFDFVYFQGVRAPQLNFDLFLPTVQLQTGIVIGGTFSSPPDVHLDGYSKQDFSYQVTPTITSDQKWLSATTNGGSPTTVSVKADPTGLAPGKYSGNLTITALAQNSLTNTLTQTIPVTLTVQPPAPSFRASGVLLATTYQAGIAVPGQPVVIFGSGFGPSALTGLSLTPDGTAISTSIADTSVLFDGVAAPMIYAANGQISTVVPF